MTDLVTNIIAYYPYSESGVYPPDALPEDNFSFYDKGVVLPLFSFETSSDNCKTFQTASCAVFLNGPSLQKPEAFFEKTGQAMPPAFEKLPFPIRQGSRNQESEAEVELEFILLSSRPFFEDSPRPDMQVGDDRLYIINDLREIFGFLEEGNFHEDLLLLVGSERLHNDQTIDDIYTGDAMLVPYSEDITFTSNPDELWHKCKRVADKNEPLPSSRPFMQYANFNWLHSEATP